jgi:hypothetical protein
MRDKYYVIAPGLWINQPKEYKSLGEAVNECLFSKSSLHIAKKVDYEIKIDNDSIVFAIEDDVRSNGKYYFIDNYYNLSEDCDYSNIVESDEPLAFFDFIKKTVGPRPILAKGLELKLVRGTNTKRLGR